MKPRGTRIPALVASVVDIVTRGLDPVQVINGPRGAQNIEADAVLLGLTPAGAEAVAVTSTAAAGLGSRPVDSFTLWGLVSCYHGDDDVQSLYDRSGKLLDQVEELLVAQRIIPAVADYLKLGTDSTWTPAHFEQGTALEVSFTITGRMLR